MFNHKSRLQQSRAMKKKLTAFLKDESGATAVEYALIAGFMAAVLVTVLGMFGDKLELLFNAIADKIAEATDDLKKD